MKKIKKVKAQNVMEYVLIAAVIAMSGFIFVSKFDMQKLKNYVFMRPADETNQSRIKIEAMTE